MFCYQCEQAAGGTGCTKIGVCGKQPDVAALQDLLVYTLKGFSQVVLEGRKVGINEPSTGAFICKALFSTLTNVNFDAQRIAELVKKTVSLRESLKVKVKGAGGRTYRPLLPPIRPKVQSTPSSLKGRNWVPSRSWTRMRISAPSST